MSFLLKDRKLAFMVLGAFLGQFSLFISYSYAMYHNPELLGTVSNAVGLFVIFLLISDFGGMFYLKQNTNLLKVYTFLRVRLIFNTALFLLVFLASFFIEDLFLSQFFIFTSPAFVFYALNVNSLLDVTLDASWFNLLSSLHLLFVSFILYMGFDSPSLLALGLATSVSIHSLITFYLADLNFLRIFRLSRAKSETCALVKEAVKILVNIAPGQIIPRFISMYLYLNFSETLVAIYNFMKVSQNLLNQFIVLLRRRMFADFKSQYIKECFSFLSVFGVGNNKIVFVIVIVSFSLYLSILPFFYNNLSFSVSIVVLAQSIFWVFSSGYFYYFHCRGENTLPALYSIVIVLVFFVIFLSGKFDSIMELFVLELSCSILSFIAVIIWKRRAI